MKPKRKHMVFCGAAVGLSLAIWFAYSFTVGLQRIEAEKKLMQCKSTMSFVRLALMQYCSDYQPLPYVEGIDGEELYCHLDFHGLGRACKVAAPDQEHGGFQELNFIR
jgi:hypothetical protein